MEDEYDEELQELLRKFLKSGLNYFRSETKNNKRMMRFLNLEEDGPCGPFGFGVGMFSKDDMNRWRKDNR